MTSVSVTSLLCFISIVRKYVTVTPESVIALTIVEVKRVELQVVLQVKLR